MFTRPKITLRRAFAFTLFSLIGLAACTANGPQQAALPPTSTLAPIVSLTPRFTATPVASRTALPTMTYTPSITPIPPTPTISPTPSEPPPMTGIVSSSQRVNVREGPDVSYNSITALEPGTGVQIIEISPEGDWYNIRMDDGSEGWISSRLMYLQPSETPLPTFTPTIDQTAIALGTAFPTAILGGAPVSPTPPPAALTAAPTEEQIADLPTQLPTQVPTQGSAVIDLNAFNMTATALVSSIMGEATASSAAQPGATAVSTSTGPVGGPTGGPVGGPTPTLGAGAGRQGNSSSQEGVDVLAYCNDRSLGLPPPRNLTAGATIDVYWSWYARTEQQIQDHNAKVTYEVAVDGTRLTNWRLYAASIRQQEDGNFYQYWYVPFGPLTSGEHIITYRVTWSEPISDGYQQFGPGTGNPSQEGSCTFTVG